MRTPDDDDDRLSDPVYDPEVAPEPAWWLALDEGQRMLLIEMAHERSGEALPPAGDWRVHSAIHAIVETQLATGEPRATGEAVTRLRAEGLGRHDAVHAAGSVIAEVLFGSLSHAERVDTAALERALDALSAGAWRAQAGGDVQGPGPRVVAGPRGYSAREARRRRDRASRGG